MFYRMKRALYKLERHKFKVINPKKNFEIKSLLKLDLQLAIVHLSFIIKLELPKDQTVQMIWTNHGQKGAKRHHPIHLHGHTFYVLKIGFGSYNNTNGKYLRENTDIHCSTFYCNQPTWSNASYGGDNIPDLKFDRPIRKDTLMVPTGAYAVIRFKTDNPGKWFLHCHIEFHSMQGNSEVR